MLVKRSRSFNVLTGFKKWAMSEIHHLDLAVINNYGFKCNRNCESCCVAAVKSPNIIVQIQETKYTNFN